MRFVLAAALTAGLAGAGSALAATKAGVTLPDSYNLDGNKLVLNGLGVREATFLKIDVYVAGLYIPAKTSDPASILKGDVPKHITLQFVRDVGKDDQIDAWKKGLKASAKDYKAIEAKVNQLVSWMDDIKSGEQMSYSYVPGKGTTVSVKGQTKGTIEGEDLQYALFRVYLGPKPPNSGLKKGLLGDE